MSTTDEHRARLKTLVNEQSERFKRTLNLVASENLLSPLALQALSSDLGHRYCIPPEEERHPALWDYPNQDAIRSIHAFADELACEVFGAAQADLRPLSGNNAAFITLLCFGANAGAVASVPAGCGGHFATDAICAALAIPRVDLAYDTARAVVDVEASVDICRRSGVGLVLLDASTHLFPHPVAELRAALGDEVVIAYDASHTMGLIGGGQFQSPLTEGADLLQGSTHKSLFGPQMALFAFARDGHLAASLRETITPLFVSNSHSHHVAALAVALVEVLAFGKDYAQQVIAAAKGLASSLLQEGQQILFPELGSTASHQLVWSLGESKARAAAAATALEEAGLHVNCIRVPFHPGRFGFRLGTAELIRRGFRPDDMETIAGFLADVVDRRRSTQAVATDVALLSAKYPSLAYCYES